MGNRRGTAVALWVVFAAVLGQESPGAASVPNPERSEAAAAMPGAVAREGGCEGAVVPAADVEASTRRVVGEVAALDGQAGKLVLKTRSGPVSLAASADTLAQLEIGDVVVVELIPEPDTVAQRDCR